MKVNVYGMPSCVLCKSVYQLLSNASSRGQIRADVELKMLEPDEANDIMKCSDNLVELAGLGTLQAPAVAMFDDEDQFVWGKGPLTSVTEVKLSELAKLQEEFQEAGEDTSVPCEENSQDQSRAV